MLFYFFGFSLQGLIFLILLVHFFHGFTFLQTYLIEHGHIIWINPGFEVSFTVFSEQIWGSGGVDHRTEQRLLYVCRHKAGIYKYLAVNRTYLCKFRHIDIKAIIINNTNDVMNHFMKIFAACAFKECCPIGASSNCTFDLSGREHANRHRFDELAVKLILKNKLGH